MREERVARERTEALLRALEAKRQQAGACERTMSASVQELSPAFDEQPGWESRLSAQPDEFLRKQRLAVKAWIDLDAERAAKEQALAALAREHGPAKATADERRRASTVAQEQEARSREELEALRGRRGALLGGEQTASFSQRLRGESERRRRALEAARQALSELSVAASAAAASAEALARARAEAWARRDAIAKELANAIAATSRTPDEVRALLERDATWIDATEGRVDSCARAVDGASAVLADRRARLSQHDEQASLGPSAAEVEAALADASDAHEARLNERVSLEARLGADEHARARRAERAGEVEAQTAISERWQRMTDLIGSADGKKFRVFAQSLTFDALLAQANHHLAELARRYSLARVPGAELELQIIDHDLGDDVRPTTSLSGGESFLVSLALALGLSSLGTQTTRVETLFIDEGFGTLDPETLDVALGTLEALQSNGRQVGVISHVAGLAERLGARVHVERKGIGRSTVRVEPG